MLEPVDSVLNKKHFLFSKSNYFYLIKLFIYNSCKVLLLLILLFFNVLLLIVFEIRTNVSIFIIKQKKLLLVQRNTFLTTKYFLIKQKKSLFFQKFYFY